MSDRIDWKIDGGLCVLVVEEYRGVAVQEHGPHVAADMRRRNAEPADLLSALGQLSPGGDGPTDNELDSIWWDHTHAACDSRAGYRALFNAGLALGEQKQAARVRELETSRESLRSGRELLREKLTAAESELAATKTMLAEVEQSHAAAVKANEEGTVMLAEAERELKQARHVAAGSADNTKRLFRELASARRVVGAAKRIADGTCIPREHSCHPPDVLALIAEVDALASAGTDADRTEAHTDSGKEETDARRNTEYTTIDPERRDARPDGGTRHSGGTHQGPECGPEVASSEPRGHEARGSEHVGSGGDGQGVGTGTGSAGSGESSGLAEPPRAEAGESGPVCPECGGERAWTACPNCGREPTEEPKPEPQASGG